jgi:hypothetical protein
VEKPPRLAWGSYFHDSWSCHGGPGPGGEGAGLSRRGRTAGRVSRRVEKFAAALKDAGYLHIPEGRRDHTTPAKPSASTASIAVRQIRTFTEQPVPWGYRRDSTGNLYEEASASSGGHRASTHRWQQAGLRSLTTGQRTYWS